jgi:hypothetical protein
LAGFVVVGVAGLATAVVALVSDQPYVVWYPPGLVGLIAVALGVFLRRPIARRFTEAEERRMRSMDLG